MFTSLGDARSRWVECCIPSAAVEHLAIVLGRRGKVHAPHRERGCDMKRGDLVAAVAEVLGLPKTKASLAVATVANTIGNALSRGERVEVSGLGVFVTADRPARKGRNPSTGETIDVPATRVVKFRPARDLKEAVRPA